mgnify:CR=1 FL=1
MLELLIYMEKDKMDKVIGEFSRNDSLQKTNEHKKENTKQVER